MLRVADVKFKYPNTDQMVLKGISFEIGQGEILAIIGKNGSGKTTLIKCITGILTPQSGQIDIVSPVGYVPQKVNFVYDVKVLDAIVMGRYNFIGAFSLPKKKDYEIARKCAEQLNITSLLDKRFSQLSGGQQQLILVARALAVGSDCIVFDEPCSALDYGNQNHILSIISGLKKSKTTAVFSTHDPNHALHIADKVLIIESSGQFRFGMVEEILTDESLSALYGMALKKIELENSGNVVVALYDSK